MTGTEPAATRPGPSWPLRWLLVASLALNLLVAGLVAGAVLRHDGPHGRMEMGPGPFAQALSAEDRRAVLMSVRERGDLRPPGREERRAAMAEVLAAIRAEPFDRQRAEAALSAQVERVAALETAIREAMVERIAAMAPDEREAFADRLEAELEQGARR